ncbi:MAG TPA: MBOAT family O-acyltransferase [Phycisphaerae bacterium]|nr:MBOAT family O-acyltransferase [Phycisphaerae bacterium]HSA25828.1 MBOAT family O-acyltransferase [Phycisphaerae bacterium]
MVFTSHVFIFYFLPLVLLIYYALPFQRNLLLLAASYVFYGWWDPRFVLLMLFATVVNYICGRAIAAAGPDRPKATVALVISVAASLGLLGFFKYFTFAEENLNRLLTTFGAGSIPVWRIALPIGISFYIFHNISYTVDVYRGVAPPVRSFRDFACFIALFPQLVAGPILRYNVIAGQLVQRAHTLDKFSAGTALFILGFAKKVLLANAIAPMADAAFAAESPGVVDAWLGVIAYAMQIYFDFSGYSDMAIGLGRMIGFEFPRNFDAPYRSESITEFWRRWHISLSTFLRDYLYIPLGGNRVSARRNYFNLTVVMLLGGLWHGANWTFVAWGAFHGGFLAFERMLGKKSAYAAFPRPLRVGLTFVLVLISWVLFRSDTLADALRYLGAMFGTGGFAGRSILLAGELYNPGRLLEIALCAALAFGPIQAMDWVNKLTWLRAAGLIALFAVGLATMFSQAFNPFLYFQF